MSRAKKIVIAVCAVVFLLGLGLFLYPDYLKYKFGKSVDERRDAFAEICAVVRNKPENAASPSGEEPAVTPEQKRYAQLYAAMQAYNQELYESGQSRLVDEYAYEKPDFLLADYGIDNGEILGFIEIPAVNIELPILNGASFDNMLKGAVYLANTSLPIGGKNTNCAIAAHNQWKGVYMFMRITELNIGDRIYIKNFWEDMEYIVTGTKVIEPDDSNEIMIKSGKDLITLSTCFYASSGKKRFIVYAERAENGTADK